MKLLVVRQIKQADPAGRQNRPEGGFTLIEILVALVVMAIIMVMIIYPFVSSTGYLAKARARSEAQQVARDMLNTMTRELSEAMDVVLLPADPSMCAFVPARPDTFPVQPSDKVIRYWLVWRSNPNANNSGVLPSDSPIGKSWYEKFSTDPRENRATANDTDSRFIARTEFAYTDSASPLYPDGLADADALNRTVPAKSTAASPDNLIADRQNFVAISPDEANFDVPVLRFTATPQVNETLQRDNSGVYVFKAKYPLWESNWSIGVYDDTGSTVIPLFTSAAIPSGVVVDPYNGKVTFVGSASETISGSGQILTYLPLAGSEVVSIGSGNEIFTRVDSNPIGNQYAINSSTKAITFDAAITPSGTITYQYALIDQTDIVIASYTTRALLNIDLIASKRDTQSGLPQTIHLQQKVKLKNVVR